MLDLWYKNAIIYCVDVDAYMDGNDDGIGDFLGLTERLDYIESLGATCIWLLPFYPSPNRDNGYDVADFYGVDPRYGTLGDFVKFTRAAHDHGLRVLVDLVVNHTSTDHPWFQSARTDPKSPHRDWYVWSKSKPQNIEDGVVFPGVQDAIWSYDRMARAWYLHRFYDHQADLNTSNPAVREEIEKIMGFWLELGVSGFRIDAVPFLIEHLGLEQPPAGHPAMFLNELRRFLSWRKAEAVLLAEANVTMNEAHDYFGTSADRVHMIFNFLLNQHVFLALVRRDAEPIRRIMSTLPQLNTESQWGTFLRNHDELDLGRLTKQERDEVFNALAPKPGMIIYERGIRRRLASMFNGDMERLRLAYSLMFSLPGTPVLWYGEEIGMGDDQSLRERDAVRTPLQWSATANAGFSLARKLIRPVVDKGPFSYRRINVEDQQRNPASLLNFMRELIRGRRSSPEIGWGRWQILETDTRILGLKFEWNGRALYTFHNLSDQRVRLVLSGDGYRPKTTFITKLSSPNVSRALKSGDTAVLPAWGYLWLGNL